MAVLRIGYDLFAGSSQAGTDGGVGGDILIETNAASTYKLRIIRTSDGHYFNNTTGAYGAGAPAEADEMTVPGSEGLQKSAISRLRCKLPALARSLATSAGLTVVAYPSGGTPSVPGIAGTPGTANNGVSMHLEFFAV
jgi:hypothetical protein